MEEKKSVRYDAKKLALEVFSKWKALIVITLGGVLRDFHNGNFGDVL